MDQAHMNTLWHIFDKSLSHAEDCVEDESPHSAEEWMNVVYQAECIIHKHEEEYEHTQQPVRTR